MSYKKIFAILLTILMVAQVVPFGQLPLNQGNILFATNKTSVSKLSNLKKIATPINLNTATPTPTVANSQDSFIKIELDKTTADVGQIIYADLKINNIMNFSGYQVNIKYDPKVLQPVKADTVELFDQSTFPFAGDILLNNEFTPLRCAYRYWQV